MRAQEKALWILRIEMLSQEGGPKSSGCSHFGNFRVEIHPDTPEEGEPWGNIINREPSRSNCRSNILKSIRNGQTKLKRSICSSLLNVITRY
mmetsp:Transcript_3816/g.10807  ORF Transcript_3816/g.10807 Transcript_3816/m.10807 type:complete len:92 (-) Transcript_3816:777-1052(-)